MNAVKEDERDALVERLCGACGFCCNGAIFHDVEVDDGAEGGWGAAAGLVFERKRNGRLALCQPCAAWSRSGHCRVHAQRPQPCRAFECRLLQDALAGVWDEGAATTRLREARQVFDRIEFLFDALEAPEPEAPLSRRWAAFLAQPIDLEVESDERLDHREALMDAIERFQTILARDFL